MDKILEGNPINTYVTQKKSDSLMRLCRNRHEPVCSHPNHENRFSLRWTPASGPLRGTAGKEVNCIFQLLIRRGGAPSGAAGFIVTEE
jgi:hypothetical protein